MHANHQNMRKEKDIFCNLCQKSLSHEDFMKHLPNDHLPEIKLTCTLCQDELASLCELETHYNYEHKSDKLFDYKILQFSKLFIDTNDVISHTKEGAEWIQKSFSFGFDNVLSKKEIRSIVKTSYNDNTEDMKAEVICELCNDDEAEEYHNCCHCGQQFLQKCYLKNHIFKKHLLLPVSIKKAINLCDICGTICSSNKTLLQHKSRLHKKQSNKKNPQKQKTSPFCHFCGKSLANKSNLRRHVLNQHSEEIGAPPNHNVFTCDHCKCFFSNKSSVKRHIENLHLKMKDTRKSISCFQCEQRFNSIKNLNAHLTIEHNVTITEEKLQFTNLGEFWEWKQEEEIRTNSRFIQLRGLRRQRRKGEEISTLKFVCNRSGIFHSKSHGKRAYRNKGSSKIGRYCSAYIEIMFKDNALVDGTYCSTHSGHDNDLRYLTLTMDEKREIYEKIKSGASFSDILDEIRNSVGKEIKRKHLVTNKDLHNIVTTFKKLSKPDQSNEEAEQTLENMGNSIDNQSDRSDRNFNNDLDICADLWVETCERMINRFDQNEPRAVNNLPKNNDPKNSNVTDAKNIFVDNLLQQNNIRDKHDRVCNDYVKNSTYINNDYTPNGLPNHVNQTCYKPSAFPAYGTENNEAKMSNDLSYFDNIPRTTPNTSEVKDFCGISSISNDLRLSKNFYPIDTSANRMIDNHIPKIPPACSNGYNSLNSRVESSDSSAYMRNANVYDKISNTNTVINTDPFNSFDFNDKMPPIVTNSEPPVCLPSSVKNNDNLDDSLIPDLPPSDDERETPTQNAKEDSKKHEDKVSDLRDKVNSVTALYNIVESELDERKKDIIRDYVDNMFKVLQYRYNKCKTQKYLSTNQEKKKKRTPPSKTKKQKKIQESSDPKPPAPFSCSPSDYPPQDTLNNSVVSNIRPDDSFMGWDQY